jgi:YfiH family protein
MALPDHWITPDWPAPAGVRAVCTTRSGGVSTGAYESLNLGDHVGDQPGNVAANRKLFAEGIAAHPVFLNQVHGQHVVEIDRNATDGIQADACVSRTSAVACTIMVADCLPVLFSMRDGSAVAAAHAGWRGLAGEGGAGVLESAVAALLSESTQSADQVLAWLGPCIGPEEFEVGAEVKAAFEAHDTRCATLFKPHAPGKWLADLPGLARLRLAALGIAQIHGNDGGREWCTVSNPSRFFSHRRDRLSGRFAAGIWLA